MLKPSEVKGVSGREWLPWGPEGPEVQDLWPKASPENRAHPRLARRACWGVLPTLHPALTG